MEKPKILTIKITEIPAVGKDKKVVKDAAGEVSYIQNDYMGIMGLFSKFDSRKYGMDGYKSYIKAKDIFYNGWISGKKEVELPLDEAVFLKSFLKSLSEVSEGVDKPGLREFEIRTLVSFISQLE